MKKIRKLVAGLLAIIMVSGSGAMTTEPRRIFAAEDEMRLNYSAFHFDVGWSQVHDDNTLCAAPEGSYITAFKANLLNQPEEMTGTVEYQANLSGKGWLDWTENGAEMGDALGSMPLEAVRMKLSGQLQENYDIYYSVLQSGQWTSWALNEETAGQEGMGLRVDGIKMSVVAKGSGEPPEPPAPVAGQFDPTKPMVALTFDDGPNASITNRILNSLEAHNGRATFFMVGSRVTGEANISSVQRMNALGCEVANHTYDHKNITKLSAAQIRSQLSRTNQNVKAACGVSPVLMRPPGGSNNGASLAAVGSEGMASVLWTIDTLDWKTRNAQKTIDTVLSQVKDGDIILMHDLYSTSADAAEALIPELIRRGYQLVTVSEMAGARGGILPGRTYSSFRP